MSYCKEIGKDKIIFLSEEDGKKPSTIEFTQPEEEPVGLVTKDGDINWSCPCIGNMAIGPCGVEFREAFSCFHNSKDEVKGRDCFEKFVEMNACMKEYPDLYEDKNSVDPEDELEDTDENTNNEIQEKVTEENEKR